MAQNAESVVQLVAGTLTVSLASVRGMVTTEFVSESVWAAHPSRRSVPLLCATARNEYSPNGNDSDPDPPLSEHGLVGWVSALDPDGDACVVRLASTRVWQLSGALYG